MYGCRFDTVDPQLRSVQYILALVARLEHECKKVSKQAPVDV